MNKVAFLGGPMGIIAGIILGALIDNMAIGIIVGFALCFGVIKFSSKKKSEADQ
ncbi:hypothetical protein [Caulobacter segnis]